MRVDRIGLFRSCRATGGCTVVGFRPSRDPGGPL